MSKATQKAGTASAGARIKSEKQVAAETAKAAKAQEKALTDSIKTAEKAFDTAEKQKTKVNKAESAQRAKDTEKYIRDTRAVNDFNAREFEKAEKEKTRIAKAESTKRAETIKSIASGGGKLIGGAISRTMGTVGRAAAGLALGGGFLIADSVHQGIKEEAMAGTIFRSAAEHGDVKNAKGVETMASEAAIKSGQKKEDILSGLSKFVGITGDLGQAKELLTDMAKLSSATGTNFEEMATFGGEVQSKLKDSSKTMSVMRAIAAQGRSGAVDIKDLAQYGTRLAAGGLSFSGDIGENITQLGAITQIARRYGNSDDAAMATMAVERLASDASKKAGKVKKKYGIDFFTDDSHTELKGADKIIADSVAATHGDQTKLYDIFGERSIRAVNGFRKSYTDAAGKDAFGQSNLINPNKDVREAAQERGKAEMTRILAEARGPELTEKDVEKDNASKLLEIQSQVNIAMETFHKEINDKLLPLMPKVIQLFTDLIPAIKKVIDFFAGGSLTEGLEKVVAAIFLAEFTKGAISAAATKGSTAILEKIGEKLFGKKMGDGTNKPGAKGDGSGGGNGAAIIGAALTGLEMGHLLGKDVYDPALSGKDQAQGRAFSLKMNANSISQAVLSGKMTTEDANKFLSGARSQQEQAKLNSGWGDLGNALFGPTTIKSFAENNTLATDKSLDESLAQLQSAIALKESAQKSGEAGTELKDAAAALKEAAAAIKMGGGGGGGDSGGGAPKFDGPNGRWTGHEGEAS